MLSRRWGRAGAIPGRRLHIRRLRRSRAVMSDSAYAMFHVKQSVRRSSGLSECRPLSTYRTDRRDYRADVRGLPTVIFVRSKQLFT